MIFNSFLFVLVFLPISVIGYYTINKTNHYDFAKLFLLGMSLWFYAYTNIAFLPVILISILLNYFIVFLFDHVHQSVPKKIILIAGICINLGALFIFKYLDFFSTTLNQHLGTSLLLRNLLLPLGISFFTFQQIAFIVDSYRDSSIRYRILDYALFVSFFPKITQGPIVFHNELIPQFNDVNKKSLNYENISKGMLAFSFGLAKKMLLADNLGSIADWGYINIPSLGTLNSLIVILSYTLQIYFDFSGYCDMASGICLMLNIDLIDNFDSPYKAKSIDEFWKRWHITLTRFFRVYVYFPLGGNRKGKVRTYLNMFLIFLLSGLWHGAAFTFILWGILHGIGICLSKLCKSFMQKVPSFLRWLGTFLFINIAWVYFRAEDITYANMMLQQLISFRFTPISADMVATVLPSEFNLIQKIVLHYRPLSVYYTGSVLLIAFLLFALIAGTCMKNTRQRAATFQPNKRTMCTLILLFIWSVLSFSEVGTFLYVNF